MTEGQNKIKVLQYLKILAILLWWFFVFSGNMTL